jgi:ribosome biogenesis GTPase / thiamine phosphate phosphatase
MENMMYELSTLGFGPFFEEQLPDGKMIPARIAAEHRGGYEVWSSVGEGFAHLAGRLTRVLENEAFPGAGDWVTLTSPPGPGQMSIIDGVLPRRTAFIRGAAGRQTRGQVVAANVDIVFVVCGLDADYNVRRIERYLARIWASGAQPAVILNKVDVCGDINVRVDEVERACLGVPVLVVSALFSDGLDEILARIGTGITAAFVGSSGAGKSTLVNALLGEERMATKEISIRDGRGCHTTTHRQLILLPEGGLIIDTPGMREMQLFDEKGIVTVFSDIEDLSAQCRFRDCRHQSEPGCAVQEAIARGELSLERLEHYLKMESEARAYEVRHDVRRRREADRTLGRRYARDGEIVRRWKQGE